ncbi:hypothetical protein [Saccharibacillus sp. JS10]|uniref:hypothetical protein n=1 Tax=Saccharibacillus sp. JS10 TaxID=2950552 RepID=UPI00210D06FC|nr:hypothetical protein [Saccharibacillus sp. JS10]MCQ4088428.1 hypothetical protein [Saccharibacillus sp. JS10]
MENVTDAEKLESIQSFHSTIRKLENAKAQMTEKGANITLVTKRLQALYVGLSVLELVWNKTPHSYNQEEITAARNVLAGLLPSVNSSYDKAKEGSPQKTLLQRRIKSLELAIQAIDELSN